MDFDDFKKMILASAIDGAPKRKRFKSKAAAMKEIAEFNKPFDFKVGDEIVRNLKVGDKYKFPDDGMYAICSKIFTEKALDSDGDLANIEIIVALEPGRVCSYLADGRFYKKAGDTSNVFKLRDK